MNHSKNYSNHYTMFFSSKKKQPKIKFQEEQDFKNFIFRISFVKTLKFILEKFIRLGNHCMFCLLGVD